ncbi:MAG: DUF4468 domain-containing protein [Taibaiella sp.]
MNKFTYNNRWNIKKGDSIQLGKPSDETFKFIFDSPSDRKNKGYLSKSSTDKSYRVEAIKRYVWSSDVENVYLLIEDNGESYFVDLYDAVQNDEVTLPEGVRKMTLVGADGGILPMKNGTVFFEKVIEVKGKNKEQIHAALRKWFADYFRDSKSVIQVSDKEEGLITGKGNYSFYLKQTVMMTPISGRVEFTININIKDNKFKYQIYGFAIEAAYKSVLPILKTQIDPVIKSSYQSQTFEEIAQALALNNNTKYCNAMIGKLLLVTSMIDESLKEAANTATDDW